MGLLLSIFCSVVLFGHALVFHGNLSAPSHTIAACSIIVPLHFAWVNTYYLIPHTLFFFLCM